MEKQDARSEKLARLRELKDRIRKLMAEEAGGGRSLG